MNQYIARQPIFNISKKLYAYEILYRGTDHKTLADVSGEEATAALLSSTFLTKDISEISGNKVCFVNFTQNLLERNLPAVFPKAKIVVEILEDVEPTPKVISVCRALKEKGYTLALDDFIYHRKFEPLLELVKIVKIDVRLTPLDSILRTLNLLANHKVKLLAEKVENQEEFEMANRLGFKYFQGYFFCKPERIGIKEISTQKLTLLRLLSEVVKKDTSIEKMKKIIANDVSITYKLMRFINSAFFYRLQEVRSIEQAIAYIGEKELRRFIMLVIISELTVEKPSELMSQALIRGKFCETLGEATGRQGKEVTELFIVGLFSLLDAMLDTPMSEIVAKLPLNEAIKNALLRKATHYSAYLQLVLALERDQLVDYSHLLGVLGLNDKQVHDCYFQALQFANRLR